MATEERIKELVKQANCKTDWKVRMSALQEIAKIDCPQRKDVLIRLALHDKVFKVKEQAFRECQKLGLKKKGKPIFLGKKDIGYKSSDITKKLARVKREAKLEEFDLEAVKTKFKQIDPEMYDVLEADKGKKFNEFLENKFKNLPKPKSPSK